MKIEFKVDNEIFLLSKIRNQYKSIYNQYKISKDKVNIK